jgi:SAM-dependent methyltransferase
VVAEWWKGFFDATYRELWAGQTSAERTAADVDGIEQVLARHGASQPARILDLACGDGRISVALASRGHDVTGLDFSASMLAAAQSRAQEAAVSLPLVEADMRDAAVSGPVDVVINWFSSFGYFAERSDDLAVLEAARAALAPGGLLLLETQHRDRIAALQASGTPQRGWRSFGPGTVVLEERWFDPVTGYAGEELTILRGDQPVQRRAFAVRLYTATELVAMLQAADLRLEAVYGGPGPSPFGVTTRLLVVARRDPG